MADSLQTELKTKCCCIPECEDKVSKRHRFPQNDENLFTIWLKAINQPKFDNLSKTQIYKSYYVCNKHFDGKFIVPGTKRGLTKDAFPTQYLTGTLPAIVKEPELVVASTSAASEVSVCKPSVTPTSPASSQIQEFLVQEMEWEATPSTSQTVPNKPVPLKTAVPKYLAKKGRGILAEVNATREQQLTPKCKKFYQKLVLWSAKTAKLQYKIKSYQERLDIAESLAKSENFQNVMGKVNNTTFNFIMQQVRNQTLAPRARRYTTDEKVLALSILKASGRGYKLLSKIFALPSRRTLTNLLNKLPFWPGFNRQMFESLSNVAKRLKEQDRVCAVLFDEMALEPTLFYNKREDLIEGLEDNGNKREMAIVDHVNVFMVKGLHRQFKQAVWFTFSSGPAQSIDIKMSLKEVIGSCQKAGLNVVATVCDQGNANQAAINSLLNDTKRELASKNIENRYF